MSDGYDSTGFGQTTSAVIAPCQNCKTLTAEVAALKSTRDMHHANYERMKAHNKELYGKVSTAEAEAARLHAALQTVRHYTKGGPDHVSDEDITNIFRVADAALRGEEG